MAARCIAGKKQAKGASAPGRVPPPDSGKFGTRPQPTKRTPRGPVSLAAILKRILPEIVEATDKASGEKILIERAELLVRNTLQDATNKDGPSRKQVWDRIEGQAVAIVLNENHESGVIVIHEDAP